MTSSKGFQHHFNIISKFFLLWLLHEKESSFCTYLFCSTEMTWMFIISTAVWVNSWDTRSVASRPRSELTSSQCSWKGNQKGKGTDETPINCTHQPNKVLADIFEDFFLLTVIRENLRTVDISSEILPEMVGWNNL